MKKMILTGMLMVSFSLFANDLEKKTDFKNIEEKVEEKTVLVKKEGNTFFYLHCRIRMDSEGRRYYEFCRHETRINGQTIILRYAEPSEYPSL